VGGVGLGLVDEFDLTGNLIRRVATAGLLDAPWGLAIALASFNTLAGNFGNGDINAYDSSGQFVGTLNGPLGNPIAIDGLLAITTGNNGSSQKLYFAAGPDGESIGLFGVLTEVPEPATVGVLGLSLAALCRVRRSRR
jgi:uncharacterized protein (TIGR03118 family)